jgi:hypothetical protein
MLQFSEVGEHETLPAMSPFAMRNENLVVNRSTVRGNPIVEPSIQRAPPPPPTPAFVAPAPFVAPTPAPTPVPQAQPDLPSVVYLLFGLNALSILLCLALILGRR